MFYVHSFLFISNNKQGHGRSAGDRLYVEKFEDYVDDVARWITDVVQADEKNKSLPNYVFGHSNGGKVNSEIQTNKKIKTKTKIQTHIKRLL